ncbi:O-acetylhomoserine aminocarboxypropyltransferase/cysteine synthase family protein [Fusibacter sp. JL216-2]|uniref:O-acetylhomoserine aminocarboxypropyltransferase/cysteine synthase family protein n=1 Tax=Fusibacter sp. JL216-2 TaxID=3071453 RepID=UPI003D341A2B
MTVKKYGLGTIAVQGSYSADETGSRTIPIHQTASYDLRDADRAANLFGLKEFGNIYTRLNNPTNTSFEEKLNLLEGGVGALSTASGQAAISLAILNICQAGDHILAASTLYGGTYTLFAYTFNKLGIDVTFVDPEAPLEALKEKVQDNTKVVYAETIGNPGLNVLDFDKFSALSKFAGAPFIVDNTFATPYLLRPFEHGVDIVVYSATKYIGGHGNSIGGAIIDSGHFEWTGDKYPGLVEPDPSYHGLKYTETFGALAYIIKARVQLIRDIGATLSPFNSFLLHTGLETLHLRVQRHSDNALELAKYLQAHEEVEWVSYPGLEDHPSYERAQKYLPKGASGVLTFGVKGGREAGKAFINNVELATLVPNIGDTRTLVIHPASTTHSQLSEKEQEASGVRPDLIRVSVGIEDIEDIKADFDQALLNK